MRKPEVITLTNATGITLQVSDYGATLISLEVPGRDGKSVNVVAGLDIPEAYPDEVYTKNGLYLGSTVGRYAGRISKGEFEINGHCYPVYHENGVHLHGGKTGFDKKYWTIERVNTNASVTLFYLSPDMEEGYPGNLHVRVTYTLTGSNALKIMYEAQTDKTTYVNLTNHSYFNLNGKGSVLDHELYINASHYLEIDDHLIPTGKVLPVAGSRFDLSSMATIGRKDFTGFDDTFVLNTKNGLKASLFSGLTGIKMDIRTNQPAMVVYTPPVFPPLPFKNNAVYSAFPAICFETQNFPDAPHHPHFPSALLQPETVYRNESTFQFSQV